MELSKYIRGIGLTIHIAAFRENVIETWNKSSRNPELFIKKIRPILERYEKSPLDTKDIEKIKKDIYKGTDNKVELLWKMNKFEAIPVREKVRLSEDVSLNILRNNLKGLLGLFDKETPDTIKASISKIIKQTLKKDELKKIHDNVKEIILKFKNPKRREMFQYLVLKPIQVALGKINPMDIDIKKKKEFLNDLREMRRKKDIEEVYSEKLMLKTRTKGAPSSQIRPHTQKLYSNVLKKIAHLFISNLQWQKGFN